MVEAYGRIADARDISATTYLKSESLFTMLDSTIDADRIANTIEELNQNPDRWLLVFQNIEQRLMRPSQGQVSE